MSQWTPEMRETVRKLWGEGHSASQIAVEIGNAYNIRFSRNAIIGVIYRLGVKSPKSLPFVTNKAKPHRTTATPKPKPAKPKVPSFTWMIPTEPLPKEDIPPAKLICIADLESHHCRYPYGDFKAGTGGFCGAQKVDGLSYCEAHTRRAYAQPKPRSSDHDPHKVWVRGYLRAKENA